MTVEEKCRKLAEEVVAGLPIRSSRIRDEIISDLAMSIEMEVEDTVEMAGYRIEDYEEGVRDGATGTEPAAPFWRRMLGLA